MGEIFENQRGLVSSIYKLLKLNNKETTQFKMWAKYLNRHLYEEDIQVANKNMKGFSRSLVNRRMHIKTTMKYHITSTRVAIIKNSNNKSVARMGRNENTHTLLEGK